jgi:hypothetical protein
MSVRIYHPTRRNIPEGPHLHLAASINTVKNVDGGRLGCDAVHLVHQGLDEGIISSFMLEVPCRWRQQVPPKCW